MKPDLETQTRIRSYLLGEADEAECETIEAMILTDDELYEELLTQEDEVIDEYLNQKLSAEARTRFENHFLATPERSEQLRFARAFDRYVSSQTTASSPPVKVSAFLEELVSQSVFITCQSWSFCSDCRGSWTRHLASIFASIRC